MPDKIIFIGNVSRDYFEKHAPAFGGLVTSAAPVPSPEWTDEQLSMRGEVGVFYNQSEYERRRAQNA